MSDAGLEQKYIKEAFDTNWVVPLGPNVNGFEKDLEDFSSGAVCMVLASEVYQKEDYIRDYQEFLEFRKG